MTQLQTHIHQGQPVIAAGKPLAEATSAMILVHGRGATAESILELADFFAIPGMAYLAPQAAGNTWYPYSFLNPIAQNEPHLSSALQVLADLGTKVAAAGIPAKRLALGGFSQGACLAAEFVARHAQRYGALLLFSGGVIGPPGTPRNYGGSLRGTPVFIGCSDVDFHIPPERVKETAVLFREMGGQVTEKIYPHMGHTIVQDEIDQANRILGALSHTS